MARGTRVNLVQGLQELVNLSEVEKETVAQPMVVGPHGAAHLSSCSKQYLAIGDDIPDLYRPLAGVMLGQWLGLYASLAHELKPDIPSPCGVISRVDGEFRIYEKSE